MNSTVEDVILANGHNSCQTSLDHNASHKKKLIATAQAEDQTSDTHAKDAQLVKFRIQTILEFATLQSVMELTKSEDQLMLLHVEDAKTANGQDTFQTNRELNVFQDQFLSAIALAKIQLMDIPVNSAHSDKDKIQPTIRDVLQLQDVTLEIRFSVSEMLKTAIDAEHALFHSSQDKTEVSAIDQDQLADAHRNTHLTDTNASVAELEKSLMISDKIATLLNNAMVQMKFLELLKTVTSADNAHQTLFQTPTEEHVLDQSPLAHVLKDTLPMAMIA